MTNIKVKNSIPLLPVVDLKATVAFYKDLGFTNLYENEKRSGGYAVMDNGFFAFHLYTYKKLPVPTPTNSHLYELENVDALYDHFMNHYKSIHGKVPSRTGLGRVGIPKSLNSDRRFSVTDPNGNHFIFVQSYPKQDHQIKTRLEKVYWESNTLAYSHESPIEAVNMLERVIDKVEEFDQESPDIVFQSFVLLTDNYLLLENLEKAKNYYDKASAWIEKIENKEDDYLKDAIQQYQGFDF